MLSKLTEPETTELPPTAKRLSGGMAGFNGKMYATLSRLADDIIRDAISLINIPHHSDAQVKEHLHLHVIKQLVLLSTEEDEFSEDFKSYAEEQLSMAVFSGILELQEQ